MLQLFQTGVAAIYVAFNKNFTFRKHCLKEKPKLFTLYYILSDFPFIIYTVHSEFEHPVLLIYLLKILNNLLVSVSSSFVRQELALLRRRRKFSYFHNWNCYHTNTKISFPSLRGFAQTSFEVLAFPPDEGWSKYNSIRSGCEKDSGPKISDFIIWNQKLHAVLCWFYARWLW